jgi:O-antigen ligase/Tfp pilus assembly protein PilF
VNNTAQKVTTATLLALVSLLPIIYIPGVYDFTRWPRLLMLQVAVILLAVTWFRSHKNPKGLPRIAVPVSAFVGWQILTTLWADNAVEALQRGSQAFTMGGFALLCAFLVSPSEIRRVILATAAATAFVSIICICQYWGIAFEWIPTAGNPSATFGYRNYLATYLVVVLPPIGVVAWPEPNRGLRWLLLTATALGATALLCTRTRGAWMAAIVIGVIGGVIWVMSGDFDRLRNRLSFRSILTVVVTLFLIGVLGLRSASETPGGQFRIDEQKSDALTALKTSFSVESSRGRTTVWYNTLDMVVEHPIVGVGLGGWQFAYPLYDKGDQITTNVAPQRPHNDLLWLLSEIGIVGLLLYAWLLLTVFNLVRRATSQHRPMAIGLALGVVGYVVHGFFSYPLERVCASAIAWFCIGSVGALSSEMEGPKRSWSRYLALPIALVGLLASVLTSERIQFDWHYAKAIEAWRRSDWSSVVQTARSAISIGPYDFRAYQLLGAGYQRQGQVDEALAAFTESLAYHPNEGHRPLGDLLVQMGKPDEAVEHFKRELELYPKSVVVRLELGRALGAVGDWAGMRQAAEEAIEQQPDYVEAILLMAQAIEKQGDLVVARGLLERVLASKRAPAHVYTQYAALLSRGRKWEASIAAYRRASELSPDNPRTHNNLGVALTKLEKYSEAALAFRRAVLLDSTYARAYRNLGDSLEKVNEPAEAALAYQAFVLHWQGDPAHRAWAEERIRKLGETQ